VHDSDLRCAGCWDQLQAQLTAQLSTKAPDTSRVTVESFAEIHTRRTRWAWAGRIPLGSPTLLVGREKLGKSTLTCKLAAELSRGKLDGDLAGEPSNVLMLSYEDSASGTIKPRLLAAGADLRRVFRLTAQRDGFRDLVSLPDDVDAVGAMVGEHACRLVIVDPFSASLGEGVNTHRDQHMRRAIAQLAQIAEAHDAALLLVAHFNKSPQGDSLTRVLGARALTAASRSVLVFGRPPDAEDRAPERILAHAACNLSAEAPSLACKVEPREVPTEVGTIPTSRLVIVGETDARADDLLASRSDDERTDRAVAAEWLAEQLADGEWHASAALKAAANADGISTRTLHRARQLLGVEDVRRGMPATSHWRLPVVPPLVGTTAPGTAGMTAENGSTEPDQGDPDRQSCHISDSGTTGAPAATNPYRASVEGDAP
jgi:hypothetical protein